jgi:LysR family hydrogen peroxide-inducible transcriptional activator
MNLQRLQYFIEIARQKHFTQAAEICNISQPSLSQQIKKLEEELGGTLFHRSREKVTLTDFGQAFLRHARAILAEVQSAEEFVHQTQEDDARTIRLGAIPTIAPYLVPALLAAIRRHAPTARFELLESPTANLEEALMAGKIDYALLSPPTGVDLECDHLTLASDELLLTVPIDHPLATVPTLTGEHLAHERILLLEKSHCLAGQAEIFCRQLGLQDHFDLRGAQIDTLLGLVEGGFGLAFTPALAVAAHTQRKVVFRSLGALGHSREIRLIWIKQQFPTRTQRLVLAAAQHCRARPTA